MFKKIVFFIFSCVTSILLAQQTDSLSIKNGIDNPSILTTHHFGIFSSRINQNFKIRPHQTTTLDFNLVSGNNFHPFVEGYFPKDPEVREQFSQKVWFQRSFNFIDEETTPADYMNIVIDAVIKEFRLKANIPLNKKHEINVTIRSYLVTKGKHPFSFFTGDETIEWFHSNIAGGEDPYGRRYYGLNQVNFEYNDRNGKTLRLDNNNFFIGGFELSHFYYPSLSINKTKKIFINLGSHLGINTSKFNPSIDMGVSINSIKHIEFKNKQELNIAIGMNLLRKNIINFNTPVDLGNNKYLATIEGNIEYVKYTTKKNYHAFGLNYQIQSRYNKKEEADYFTLKGKWQEINGGWQHGVSTLYKAQSNLSFIYTYGRPKFKIAFYLKEDFEVNNAPDLQTGLSIQIPVFK